VRAYRGTVRGADGTDDGQALLVGYPAAEKYLHFDGHPSQIYLRAGDDQVRKPASVPAM
jgi:hypothetical protein